MKHLIIMLTIAVTIPSASYAQINWAEHVIDGFFNGACSIYAIDLDSDGDIDVLGAANLANDITWWENDGSENFTEHTIDDSFNGAWSVFAIDLDSDGDIDVLGAANAADDITWWENDGSENFTERTIDDSFNGAYAVFAIDMEPDGDIDVLGAAAAGDAITWWENDGSENFTEHTITDSFDYAISIYAIDLDGDGDIDVLGAANLADDITWWENDGSENFTEHTIDDSFDGASSVYAIDMDDDGDVDVLGAANVSDDITWWKSDLKVLDVGTVSIDIPSIVPQDTTINPRATVKNMGTDTVNIPVTCEIEPGGYIDTQIVSNLAPNASMQVIFDDPFTFEEIDFYTVTVYTQLEADENPTNDTLEMIIETYDPGIAEGISDMPQVLTFNAPTITKKGGEVKFTLPQATTVTLVIYDVLGRLAETVISKRLPAGSHRIDISLDFPAGIYFYNLKTASGEAVIKKFLLME
jgi:hypothetical protein